MIEAERAGLKIARRDLFLQILSGLMLPSLLLAILAFHPCFAMATPPAPAESRLSLATGWAIQSSCEVKAGGGEISAPGFRTEGWHAATVPTTVVAALVADKTYPDPYFGMNLRSIPGTTYPVGKNFAELPLPKDSPFRCSWWYRTEFRAPENFHGQHVWLHFNGINYRANIWLNGQRVATAKEVAGMYRRYEFDVTPFLSVDRPNSLAVETFAQTEKDLGINWQDWNPAPPDRDMGLFGEVFLDTSGPVALRNPQVVTHFPNSSLVEADLTVMAELRNATKEQVAGELTGRIEGITFRQTVTLKPGETRTVRFTPDAFPQLRIKDPKLWWPAEVGPQNLHELSVSFAAGSQISASETIRFGIREVTSEVTEKGYRLFRVNGQRILIRGGGWAQDMLLRHSRERMDAEFRYIREMHLNAIRLEGQFDTDELYDFADERGILIMPGWVCCTYWQKWEKWKPVDLEIASESLRSQTLRMRSHPSVFVWLNSSDVPPPARVEKAYLNILKETDWPNPVLSSASAMPTPITGPSGVKMTGPYDYVPPSYWLTDTGRLGGAFGFNTETSPGPAVPPAGSLNKMLPAAHLWPIDEFWNFHASSENFANLNRLNKAMNEMFGPPASLEDYVTKSQAMAYDAERAMFEAYARNKYTSTGVIQWMLNNAWPSLYWHLYDYYLQPAGGYFGTKKACEPLHIQYSYDDQSVVVVNNLYRKFSGLTVSADLYDFGLQKRFSQQGLLDIAPDAVERAFTIPPLPRSLAPSVYFLRLSLLDGDRNTISSNFYWLASNPARIAWNKTLYMDDPPPKDLTYETSVYTPASPYDDLTILSQLPKVKLAVAATVEHAEQGTRVGVKLKNPTDHLAFQVRLGIRRKNEDAEILPVLWDDNFLELMPGESREIMAQFLSPQFLEGSAELVVMGWNIEPTTLPLAQSKTGTERSGGGEN